MHFILIFQVIYFFSLIQWLLYHGQLKKKKKELCLSLLHPKINTPFFLFFIHSIKVLLIFIIFKKWLYLLLLLFYYIVFCHYNIFTDKFTKHTKY